MRLEEEIQRAYGAPFAHPVGGQAYEEAWDSMSYPEVNWEPEESMDCDKVPCFACSMGDFDACEELAKGGLPCC